MKKDKSKYSGLMEEKANLNCKLFQIIYIYIAFSHKNWMSRQCVTNYFKEQIRMIYK